MKVPFGLATTRRVSEVSWVTSTGFPVACAADAAASSVRRYCLDPDTWAGPVAALALSAAANGVSVVAASALISTNGAAPSAAAHMPSAGASA